MRLKKGLAVTTIIACVFLFGFSSNAFADKTKYEEKFNETIVLAKSGKVVLTNISGDIEVRTWNRAEVDIDAKKISKASTMEKAKQYADKVTIEIDKQGDVLTIKTDYPKTSIRNLNVSVEYVLMIPEKASASMKSVSGDIVMRKIGGKAKANSVSGDLVMEMIAGPVVANAVSGDVKIKKAESGVECESVSGELVIENVTGNAFLKAVSGDISVRGMIGSVEAESVSGDVEVIGVSDASTVSVKVLSGDVDYAGEIYANGRYKFKSHSGDVVLILPARSAFDLEAKTFSGSIDSAFEIMVMGKLSKRELKGSVNSGGAEVTVSTFSGDVRLKKK
jgi:hypothetical protein